MDGIYEQLSESDGQDEYASPGKLEMNRIEKSLIAHYQ